MKTILIAVATLVLAGCAFKGCTGWLCSFNTVQQSTLDQFTVEQHQ